LSHLSHVLVASLKTENWLQPDVSLTLVNPQNELNKNPVKVILICNVGFLLIILILNF